MQISIEFVHYFTFFTTLFVTKLLYLDIYVTQFLYLQLSAATVMTFQRSEMSKYLLQSNLHSNYLVHPGLLNLLKNKLQKRFEYGTPLFKR